MSTHTQPRKPAGTPIGGQYDTSTGSGAAADLGAITPPDGVLSPESMAIARRSLWRVALSRRDGRVGSPMDSLSVEDIDPTSKARVESDFGAWIEENAEAVKAFTELVPDPYGGDPAGNLAEAWWSTRNGDGAGFHQQLFGDVAYRDAVRDYWDERQDLADTFGSAGDAEARVRVGQPGAESDLARADHELEKATGFHTSYKTDSSLADGGVWVAHVGEDQYEFATKSQARQHIVNKALDDMTPMRTLERHAAQGDQVADRAFRRARVLAALSEATPLAKYNLHVGDDYMVHLA